MVRPAWFLHRLLICRTAAGVRRVWFLRWLSAHQASLAGRYRPAADQGMAPAQVRVLAVYAPLPGVTLGKPELPQSFVVEWKRLFQGLECRSSVVQVRQH